ncbi:MAG TPA: hypothetical protein ENJ83_01425 [Rhodospirillales bacterium]|nr:hypothetical protein [Rhodospirillales bacterium]
MTDAPGRSGTGRRGVRLLVAALFLAGCAEAGPRLPPDLAALQEKAAEEPYPDLREVPPRPRLGYGIAQRRAIVRGLAADRDNAAYEGAKLRYGAGLAATPPRPPKPPTPPAPEPAESGRHPPPPSDLARAYVEETLRGAGRTGELDDLIDWMERFGDPAARPVAASGAADLEAALPAPPVEIAFLPGRAEITPAGLRRLRGVARLLRESGRGVIVEAAAPSPSLGQERLRAVARELVALGVAAHRITMRQRGEGDGARIRWAEAPSDRAAGSDR